MFRENQAPLILSWLGGSGLNGSKGRRRVGPSVGSRMQVPQPETIPSTIPPVLRFRRRHLCHADVILL